MRKHRIYGVVIAVLVGTLFTNRPSSSHHATGVDMRRTDYRLASAALPAGTGYRAPVVSYDGSTFSLLSPPGQHQDDALWSYKAALFASPGPASPPAPPPQPHPPTVALGHPTLVPLTSAASVGPVRHDTPAPAPVARPRPVAPPGPVAPPAGGVWAGLRRCESGGDYSEDTGNGFYGAYQFSLGTWRGLGFPGLPSQASPAVQDAAARALQARSGWGQWPACSRMLGLT